MAAQKVITLGAVNMRSEPDGSKLSTRIAFLDSWTELDTEEAAAGGWTHVAASLNGADAAGYVATRYLANLPLAEPFAPRVFLEGATVSRQGATAGERAYSLNETGIPRRTGATRDISELVAIIDWLDVEGSPRYLPFGNATFCNIYAYDYCYLARAYLPHVWWNVWDPSAFVNGTPRPRLGENVHELTANALHDWLHCYAGLFGWSRIMDLGELQDAANSGKVCIASGRREGGKKSGHVTLVVPESSASATKASRSAGRVVAPLQSEAGDRNRKYFATAWWNLAHCGIESFSFWMHE